MFKFTVISTLFAIIGSFSAADVPLYNIKSLIFEGAQRMPINTYGGSRLAFLNGTLAIDNGGESIFIVGHEQHQFIAEFALKSPSLEDELSKLPILDAPVQMFASVLDRGGAVTPGDKLDKITGLKVLGESLIVNLSEYYDGDANAQDTTLVFKNKNDLANSTVTGYLKADGGYHVSGWITDVPLNLKEEFGADLIFGNASNYAINSRSSIGPSLFLVNSADVMKAADGNVIPTKAVMDFSIENEIEPDAYNKNGGNHLWTEVSKANIGFIIPGTNTYAVIGSSGGHESGIGYKITQDNGHLCGGPCPYSAKDTYNYYWLFDVRDFNYSLENQIHPYDLKPYDYGVLNLPFEDYDGDGIKSLVAGVTFDRIGSKLHIVLSNADREQSIYEPAPILLTFRIDVNSPKSPKIKPN